MSLRTSAEAPLAVAPVAVAPASAAFAPVAFARAQTGSRLALVLGVGEATGETEKQMRPRIMADQEAKNEQRDARDVASAAARTADKQKVAALQAKKTKLPSDWLAIAAIKAKLKADFYASAELDVDPMADYQLA